MAAASHHPVCRLHSGLNMCSQNEDIPDGQQTRRGAGGAGAGKQSKTVRRSDGSSERTHQVNDSNRLKQNEQPQNRHGDMAEENGAILGSDVNGELAEESQTLKEAPNDAEKEIVQDVTKRQPTPTNQATIKEDGNEEGDGLLTAELGEEEVRSV